MACQALVRPAPPNKWARRRGRGSPAAQMPPRRPKATCPTEAVWSRGVGRGGTVRRTVGGAALFGRDGRRGDGSRRLACGSPRLRAVAPAPPCTDPGPTLDPPWTYPAPTLHCPAPPRRWKRTRTRGSRRRAPSRADRMTVTAEHSEPGPLLSLRESHRRAPQRRLLTHERHDLFSFFSLCPLVSSPFRHERPRARAVWLEHHGTAGHGGERRPAHTD